MDEVKVHSDTQCPLPTEEGRVVVGRCMLSPVCFLHINMLATYVCPHRKYKECVFKCITGILFGPLFYNLFFHLTWSFRLEGLNSEPSLWFHSPVGVREAETQSISADLAQGEACLSLVGLPKGDYLFLIHSKMWCVCYI